MKIIKLIKINDDIKELTNSELNSINGGIL
ncbi:bacteriocin [Romboutsia lituseburensis]